MTFIDRALIYEPSVTNEAMKWCKEYLEHDEWTLEFFDQYDCFYFTDRTICSMFILMFGGKHMPIPEKNYV